MTTEDYKQLEKLLAKLGTEIGSHRFCIIKGAIGENFQIASYNNEGDMIHNKISYDIESCVTGVKLNNQ